MNQSLFQKQKITTSCWLQILSLVVFVGTLGSAMPVIFNEGSTTAKYIVRQQYLAGIQEQSIEEHMNATLFGEESPSPSQEVDQGEIISAEALHQRVETIRLIDRIIACFAVFISGLFLFPKLRQFSFLSHLLLFVFAWFLGNSFAAVMNEGKKFYELSPLGQAVRWGSPLILWSVLRQGYKSKVTDGYFVINKAIFGLLIFCCMLTFATHGWEAYKLNPSFQDLIFTSSKLIGLNLSENVVKISLTMIGTMDMILAASLIFYRVRPIFLWMAIWGFVTACSRPLSMGIEAWPEMAMRVANGGLPLVCFVYLGKISPHLKATQLEKNNFKEVEKDKK